MAKVIDPGNNNVIPGTTGYDPTTFAEAVLTKLGVPVTPANLDFFTSWEAAEGGHWHNSAHFNPLGTTLHLPGSGPMGNNPNQNGGDPVQAYASWADGIAATVQMLNQPNMAPIKLALAASDAKAAAQAVVNGPWGTSSISLGSGASYAKQAGVSNGPAGATPDTQTTFTKTDPAGTADQLAQQFGYSSAFFNSDPSLKKLIDQYKNLPRDASGNIPQATLDRFKADLFNTPWYQKHSVNQRQWIQLQTADPTEAAHQLLGVQQTLAQQAKQLGLNLTPTQLHDMANNAISMYGSNVPAGVVNDILGAQVQYKGTGTYSGQVGSDVTVLKNLATQYGITLSDATMQGWLRNIVQNGVDPTSYTDYLKQQSASLYPTIKPQLDQGLTFQQAVDPYRQHAAQLTDIDPNSISFNDPKWLKAIQQVDPTTGARTAMPLDQWDTLLRTDPVYGYDKTPAAIAQAGQMASKITQLWGKTNG